MTDGFSRIEIHWFSIKADFDTITID